MNDGYVKLYRKFKSWEWYSDTNTKILFLHLLLSANYEDKKWKEITILKGQILTGRKKLSKELRLSEQQIRTSLAHLKSTNEITITSTKHYSVITLINWGKYQSIENNQPTKCLKSNRQSTNNPPQHKNIKNIKNIKNNIYAQMFNDFWSRYPKKRNKAKCKEWYLKNKPSEELQKKIMMSILFFSSDESWKKDDGKFIPYPSTFLNQKRWEDFYSE